MKSKFSIIAILALCTTALVAAVNGPYTIVDNGSNTKEVGNQVLIVQGLDGSGNRVNLSAPVVSGSVSLTGGVVAPTATANVASGTISAGCRQITFVASSDFSGTILTNFPLSASAGLTITAPAGSTIGDIVFTRSAGTLYTIELR